MEEYAQVTRSKEHGGEVTRVELALRGRKCVLQVPQGGEAGSEDSVGSEGTSQVCIGLTPEI